MNFKTIAIIIILSTTTSCAILSDSYTGSDDQNELRVSEEALSVLYKKHGITNRNIIEVAIPKPSKKNSRVSEEVLIDSKGKEVK